MRGGSKALEPALVPRASRRVWNGGNGKRARASEGAPIAARSKALKTRTPGALPGRNKPGRCRGDQAVEGVRNAEDGERRAWKPVASIRGSSCAEGAGSPGGCRPAHVAGVDPPASPEGAREAKRGAIGFDGGRSAVREGRPGRRRNGSPGALNQYERYFSPRIPSCAQARGGIRDSRSPRQGRRVAKAAPAARRAWRLNLCKPAKPHEGRSGAREGGPCASADPDGRRTEQEPWRAGRASSI